MKNQFFNQVSTFNSEVIGYASPVAIDLLPEDVKELSLIQLREEISEFETAQTKTEAIDAIIDLVYFAYGCLHKMGISEKQFSKIATLVHTANMTKAAGKKAAREYNGTAQDAVKPVDFVPPEIAISKFIKDSEFKKQYKKQQKLLAKAAK